MIPSLVETIKNLPFDTLSEERKSNLQPLVNYVLTKIENNQSVNLNFICTHNSRRSHLAQIWAQIAAAYYGIEKVYCYSGGTEATALYPMVKQTLENQGLFTQKLSLEDNPIYAIKYSDDTLPIIAFSKTYDNSFNPKTNFAAIMTCSHADENCPLIIGAEKRIPITYDDPKAFDNTPLQEEKYLERSVQIATEMFFTFHQIKQNYEQISS